MRTKVILVIMALVALAACKKAVSEPEYISSAGFSLRTSCTEKTINILSGETYSMTISALMSDAFDFPVTITVSSDYNLLDSYNTEHGTSYPALPSTAYVLSDNPVTIPEYETESTTCRMELLSSELSTGIEYLLPVSVSKVDGLDRFTVTGPLYVIVKKYVKEKGSGTEAQPYNLYTPEDIAGMRSRLKHGEKVYFKLQNDIDMTGVDYEAFNNKDPFDYLVDIDGQGHTLSNLKCNNNKDYPSFAGILYGNLYDIRFADPVILSKKNSCGVVAGYVGDTGRPAYLCGVKVTGASIYSEADNCGGLAGVVVEATVENCSFEGFFEAPGKKCVGGIAGNVKDGGVIKNCWSKGFGRCTRELGGIAGNLSAKETKIINCYSEVDLYSQFAMGGICGHANLNSGTYGQKPGNEISGCLAWNSSISSYVSDTGSHYSNGAVIGFGSPWNTMKDCYRRPDMYFLECPGNIENNSLIDQPNADSANPLVTGTSAGKSGEYIYPYHGRSAQTSTAARIAKNLGWDQSIWNLEGNIPLLK